MVVVGLMPNNSKEAADSFCTDYTESSGNFKEIGKIYFSMNDIME